MTTQMNSRSKQSFSGRLVHWVAVRQERKADRQIMDVLAKLPNNYRNDYVTELERRLLGQ